MASKTRPTRAAITSKASLAQVQAPTQALARTASKENRAAQRARHKPSRLSAAVRLAQARARRIGAGQALYAKRRSLQQANAQRQSLVLRNRAARGMYLAQGYYSRQQYTIKGLLNIRASRGVRLAMSKYPLASPWAIPFRSNLTLSGATARPATKANAASKAATTRNATRRGTHYKPRAAPGPAAAVTARWITAGNDGGARNCTSVAIANHLLHATGIRVTDEDIAGLDALHDGTLREALLVMRVMQPWRGRGAVLARALPAQSPAGGQAWGFEVPQGPHAALSTGPATVVSWGDETPFTGEIEEAYELSWTTVSPSPT